MKSRNRTVELLVLALLVGLSLSGSVLVLVATPYGVGANSDSAAYLLAARNLLHGHGLISFATVGPIETLTEPLVWWPPFLSVVLAGIGLTGVDPVDSVRFLNALLFAVNIGLTGWLAWRLAGSGLIAAVAAIMILGAPHILVLHAMAWSEPLFLALVMAALALLARYLAGGTRWLLLVVALSAAAAALTRYIGMSFILLGGLALLVWPGRDLRRRFEDAIGFGVVGVLPAGLWMLRNLTLVGTTSGRTAAFHPPALTDLKRGVFTFLSWLAPVKLVNVAWPWLLAILGLVAVVLGVSLWRTRRRWLPKMASWQLQFRSPRPFRVVLVYLLIGFGGVYFLAVLASITLLDAFVRLDSRMLSPVYFVGVIVGVGLGGRLLTQPPRPGALRWLRLAVSGLLGLLVISYGLQGLDWVARNHATGADLGVGGRQWHYSPLLALVEELPPDTLLSSNRPEALYVLAGRMAYRLPLLVDSVTALENPAYEAEMELLGNWLGAEQGAVVYFLPEGRTYMPPIEDFEALWDICRTETAADGSLYFPCPPGSH